MRRNALLTILAGIALAVCLAVTLEARPNPQMICDKTWRPGEVRCEAKYAWPEIPQWSTSGGVVKDYGRGYGEGFGMNMAVGSEWTLVEARVGEQVIRHYFRMDGDTMVHKDYEPPTDQIASQPP